LIAQGHAACIRGYRLRAAAEQLVQRPAHGFGADVPQRLVDAAHGEAGAGTHAVARELLVVDFFPHTDHVRGIHAENELPERRVDEMRDGTRCAPVVRFAITGYAAGRGDLDDDRVALDDAADTEADTVFRFYRK